MLKKSSRQQVLRIEKVIPAREYRALRSYDTKLCYAIYNEM